MNSPFPDDLINAPHEGIPASVPRLIDAVAVFDADPDTSRRYLSSASALFGAKRARSAECISQSKSRSGLLAWELNRLVHYIETHLADKITTKDLRSLIDVSQGRLFRAFKISVGVPPLHDVTTRRVECACAMLMRRRCI